MEDTPEAKKPRRMTTVGRMRDRLAVMRAHLEAHSSCPRNVASCSSAGDFSSMEGGASSSAAKEFVNWVGVHHCHPNLWLYPHSVDEVKTAVLLCRERKYVLRVVGSGHSINDACCASKTREDERSSTMRGPHAHAVKQSLEEFRDRGVTQRGGVLVSLNRMNRILNVDLPRRRILVEAGVTLRELNPILWELGLAFENLGSISDQTVAGIIATGTHGNGLHFKMVGATVRGISFVDGLGRLVTCSDEDDRVLVDGSYSHDLQVQGSELLAAMQCHLGALGVLCHVEIECDRAFYLKSSQRMTTLDSVIPTIDTTLRSNDHYKFLWIPHTDETVEWTAQRLYVEDQKDSLQLRPLKGSYLKGIVVGWYFYEFVLYIASFCPKLLPWVNRFFSRFSKAKSVQALDRSYNLFNHNCLFPHYVDEWAIPYENLVPALRALRLLLASKKMFVHFPIEIRMVAPDNSLLSPCTGRLSAFIGIMMYCPYGRDPPYLAEYFSGFEDIMKSFGGRPHWGKEFFLSHEDLREMYPDTYDRFVKIRNVFDPDNVFVNEFVRRVLPIPGSS